MQPFLKNVCRVTSLAVLLRFAGAPSHVSAPLAILLAGCNICITAMSQFIRQTAARRVAPVTAAASTANTAPRRVVPGIHDGGAGNGCTVQTIDELREDYYTVTPLRRTARLHKEDDSEHTPKSQVHQEILRKKRQRDAGIQTDPTAEVQNDTEHGRIRRKYVKYLLKAAAEKIRADKLQRKYGESELAGQLLRKRVIAMEKAAEKGHSRLEVAYEEQASTLRAKCEAMFASFEEMQAAHQRVVQEHKSLLAAHERLEKRYDRVLIQVSKLPPWIELLEGEAEEWPQLRQKHSILASDAPAANTETIFDKDSTLHQEQEAMLWRNHPPFDEPPYSDTRTPLSTSDPRQPSTPTVSPSAAATTAGPAEYSPSDAKLENERTAATNTILIAIGAGKIQNLMSESRKPNAIETIPLV